MLIDLKKASYDAKRYEYKEGIAVWIRPFPSSMAATVIRKDGKIIIEGEDNLRAFQYCWTKAEGLVDADDQPLALNDDIKKTIYDFAEQICNDAVDLKAFIMLKMFEGKIKQDDEAKNS
jgi:hypothetical protein